MEIVATVGVQVLIDFYVIDPDNNGKRPEVVSYPPGRTSNMKSLPNLTDWFDNGYVKMWWTPDPLDITSFTLIADDQLGNKSTWNASVKICNCSTMENYPCDFSMLDTIDGI